MQTHSSKNLTAFGKVLLFYFTEFLLFYNKIFVKYFDQGVKRSILR
jgi:hypothetical protein